MIIKKGTKLKLKWQFKNEGESVSLSKFNKFRIDVLDDHQIPQRTSVTLADSEIVFGIDTSKCDTGRFSVRVDADGPDGGLHIHHRNAFRLVPANAKSSLAKGGDGVDYELTVSDDLSGQATSGGGVEQVNSDWEATSGKAEILNKPFHSKPGNKIFEINGETALSLNDYYLSNFRYGYPSMVLPWQINTDVKVTIDGHTVNTKLHSGIIAVDTMMPIIGNLEAAMTFLYEMLLEMLESGHPSMFSSVDAMALLEKGEPLFMVNLVLADAIPFMVVNTNVIDVDSESSITIAIGGHTQTVGIEMIEVEGFPEGFAMCLLDSFVLYPEIPACDVDLDGEVRHLKCFPVQEDDTPVSEGPALLTPGTDPFGESDLCYFSCGYASPGVDFLMNSRNPIAPVHSISVRSGNARTAYFGKVFSAGDYHDGFYERFFSASDFGKSVYFAAGDSLRRYTPELKTLWDGSSSASGHELGTASRKLAFSLGDCGISLCAFTDTINRSPIAVYGCDEKLLPSHSVVHERQRAVFDEHAWAVRIENPGEAVLFGCGFRIPDMPPVFYCGNAVDVVGTDEDDYDGNPYNGIVFTPVDKDTVIARRMFGINDECVYMSIGLDIPPMTFSTFIGDDRNTPSSIKIVSDKTTPPNMQYCRDFAQYDELLEDYVVRNNWVDLKFRKNSDNQWESEELAIFSREVSAGDWTIVKGDISFRGDNPDGLTEIVGGGHKTTRFVIDGECYVYGMPLSLLSKDFSVMSVPYAGFESLFEDCSGIVGAGFDFWCHNAGSYAFYRMFKNSGLEFYNGGDDIVCMDTGVCGDYAFAEMFEGSNIVAMESTPPAGKNSAYRMLANCENLESFYLYHPPLEDSYKEIAAGCGNLQEVHLVDDFDWNEGIGTKDWLKDTPATGTLYCAEALGTDETIERGDDFCPEGWTVDNSNNN